MDRVKGIIYAAVSSATFGLAPFFSISLLAFGFSSFEVLTYRWGVAAVALLIVGAASGARFRCSLKDIPAVLLLALFRAATSFSLLVAYKNISSGAASIIHFMYPLAVALGMMLFFREKKSWTTFGAVALSLAGAAMLSMDDLELAGGNMALGLVCAVISVFAYSSYVIGVRISRVSRMEPAALTFYVTGAGALLFMAGGWISGGGIRLETDPDVWLYILGLALPATALSNISLVKAINLAGATLASLLGALEPLTAVVIGAAVFGEPFTALSAFGIILIVAAVSLVLFRQERT